MLAYLLPLVAARAVVKPRDVSCEPPIADTNLIMFNANDIAANYHAATTPSIQHYYTSVIAGNPPQEFWMTVDTGSSDFWLPSTKLEQSLGVNASSYFSVTTSSNGLVPYGNGSVSCGGAYAAGAESGTLATGSYSIGGRTAQAPICVVDSGTVPIVSWTSNVYM